MMSSKHASLFVWIVAIVCPWSLIYGQVSRHRTVTMSSQFLDWSGSRVVDGNYNTSVDSCHCCAATDTQNDPWINIDLGDTYMVTRIIVYGRTDGHIEQNLNGLFFKLDGMKMVPTKRQTEPIRSYTFILERPSPARNITLVLPGNNRLLVLCEFDVYNDMLVSTNKPVTLSSNYTGWGTPQGAVDGSITCNTVNPKFQCCAATNTTQNPWLRVNLMGYFYINYIVIQGRTDSLPDDQRLRGFDINLGYTLFRTIPLDVTNYYESGPMRVGPVDSIELTQTGVKTLVVCELTAYGVCPNGTYGQNCIEKCGYCRDGSICNQIDGACYQCEDGYTEIDKTCKTLCPSGTYGHNCTKKCGYCRDGSICNQIDGACYQCEDGFTEKDNICKTSCLNGTYGYNCTEKCGHCRDGSSCNQTNGACYQCADGYTDTDNTCKTFCPNGIYGYNCTENCGHCRDGSFCYQTNGVCNHCEDGYTETDKTCKTQCPNGKYGYNCIKKCGHCGDGSICNQINGACNQCADGYTETDKTCKTLCSSGTYGHNCTKNCGHCRDGLSCNQTNGTCERCEDGYTETDKTCKTSCTYGTYGNNCTETCGQCRDDVSCNQTNGACDQCEDGFKEMDKTCKTACLNGTYGHDCTGTCGHCRNDRNCNKTNGVCDQCDDGYMETDMLCIDPCPDGHYGLKCQLMCGNCYQQSTCLKDTGNCPDGCEPGFVGSLCLRECDDGKYGDGCTSTCGHCHGGKACHKQNGSCRECECGYTGHDCKIEIGAVDPAKQFPDCTEAPNIVAIVGGTVASILAIEGVALAIVCLIRKRRHTLEKGPNGDGGPYEFPNRNVTEGEHHYETAMELNINTPEYVNTRTGTGTSENDQT